MIARALITALLICAGIKLPAQVSFITTIAGKAGVPASDSGDQGPATNARFYGPEALYVDKYNNIYIADAGNSKVKKIDASTGIIITVAGTGIVGALGDGSQATAATLVFPEDIKIDTSGNIYIADAANNRIRKIDIVTGIITTVAGNGINGGIGDGGLAVNAELNQPSCLCLDNAGNIYIADWGNNRIRKVDASTGIITAFAGTGASGYTGDGTAAVGATFSGTISVTVDDLGNIFISDLGNHVLRKVSASTNVITTIAGSGINGNSGDGGLAVNANLSKPTGTFIDKQNNIFIADFGYGVVRKIDAATGIITTVAGNGTWGYSGDGGPATSAELSCSSIAFDSYGQMIIADYGTTVIRKVINPKLAVNNTTKTNNDVSVFPNPVNDELTIEYHLANTEDAQFQIIDLTGRIVTTKTLKSGKRNETIDIRSLSQGLYLYKVIQNNLIISTGRIIRE